jgi:hypothetical protein
VLRDRRLRPSEVLRGSSERAAAGHLGEHEKAPGVQITLIVLHELRPKHSLGVPITNSHFSWVRDVVTLEPWRS